MPSLDYGLYSILTGNATLTGLIAARIYPERRATSSILPALVYKVGFSTPYMTLSGKFADLSNTTVDIISYSYTRINAAEIINQVATIFSNFTPGVYGGVTISGIQIQSVTGSYVDATAGESQGIFTATLQTQIYFVGF